MSSDRKKIANRRNAIHSTGPTSALGKRRSRLNALKHGLFSKVVMLNEEERHEFESICNLITKQLAPATALQQVACEDIVYCSWRRTLAMRLEMKRLRPQLAEEPNPATDAGSEQTAPSRWYGASRADLRRAVSYLLQLRQDVEANGALHLEKCKDALIRVYGQSFYEELTNWAPRNVTAIQLAVHLDRHAKTFKKPLPEGPMAGERIVVDPNQSWQMAVKLIDEKIHHLEDLKRISEREGDDPFQQHTVALDITSRYYSAVMRDLERAIARYLRLKEVGL